MSEIFDRVIVPLLYGQDSSSVWRVDRSNISSSSSSTSRSSLPSEKSLTYGEVLPSSVERHVLPLLALRDGDVVVDLGSGTGKIPLQVALAARAQDLRGVSCRGVELARERHDAARRAYAKLECVSLAEVERLLADDTSSSRSSSSPSSALPSRGYPSPSKLEPHITAAAPSDCYTAQLPSLATAIASALRDVATSVSAVEGDFLRAHLADVTVVFVNNTVFDAQLMNSLADLLATLPRLRTLVLLRPLCSSRHGARCLAQSRACCRFSHPPLQGICHPTWCASTTLFAYQRADGVESSRFVDGSMASSTYASSTYASSTSVRSTSASKSTAVGAAAGTAGFAPDGISTLSTPPRVRAPKRPLDVELSYSASASSSAKKRGLEEAEKEAKKII